MANEVATQRAIPIPKPSTAAGFVAPVVGRKALRDVTGYFGFTLVKKGDVITASTYERAQQMARLAELIASTHED